MPTDDVPAFAALRHALAEALATAATPSYVVAGGPGWLLSQTAAPASATPRRGPEVRGGPPGDQRRPDHDHDLATSSAEDESEQVRLIALVELARSGDKEAFGLLYDHYQPSVHRYLYYRLGTVQLAEDLTGETFFRALRSMNNFRWQGRDFGAWLMTIARNLVADHYKSGRTRLEQTTEDLTTLDSAADGPEDAVLDQLTNEDLMAALRELPRDQQDCLVMRFLQGMSLAETANALDRSCGAIKQLQLRAVRNLAALLPEGMTL